jgi:predicted metalloprotease
MRLSGRRESSNVEDRRGMSTGAKAGIGGIGAVIVAALFAWISGGDPMQAGLQAFQEQMQQQGTETVNPESFTEEEQELAKLSSQILAGTEDVWTKGVKEQGLGN